MMVGQSQAMVDLRARIGRVARTNFTVLIEGESGAGKELVAHAIHDASPRRSGPFVPVNCAALVESLLEAELFGIEDRTATGVRGRRGKFELADHGTLFLDEVADLSPAAQAKLLRVLQDFSVERVGGGATREVDTRVVAATNRRLPSLVEDGLFRSDLYYRLSGVELHVPPLRARRQDIPLLLDHFRGRHRRLCQWPLAASAQDALIAYDWPGNVRQLARVIERALALSAGPEIGLEDLPADISKVPSTSPPGGDEDHTLRAWSSRYAHLVLARCQGNKTRTCALLDISYHTLQALLDYNGAAGSPRREAAPIAQAQAAGLCERAG